MSALMFTDTIRPQNMQFVDTHVHLNFDVFEKDLAQLRERWQAAGVTRLVHSCVEPSEVERIRSIVNRIPEISYAVGLHPLDADKWTETTQAELRHWVESDARIVALGEMGLDYYKAENHDHQKQVFWKQLEIAHTLNKPVIIHCRDASADLYALVLQFQKEYSPVKGVMHCWSGSPQETEQFLNYGFYISFSGVVTFKNAHQIQESAKIVPLDRLLIETDCPFLAPTPKRGKRNEPSYVRYVAEYLATLRNIPLETLADHTTRNAYQLFNL